MRDEFLNGQIFYSIKELRVLAEPLAQAIQHRPATPLVGLQVGWAKGMAGSTCGDSLHRSELRNRCASLTKLLVHNIGQTVGFHFSILTMKSNIDATRLLPELCIFALHIFVQISTSVHAIPKEGLCFVHKSLIYRADISNPSLSAI